LLPQTAALEFGGEDFHVPLVLPFSWELFYFASVSFSLAGLIYYFACPPLVRDFDTYSQYEDIGKGPQYLLQQFFGVMFGPFLRHPPRIDSAVKTFVAEFTEGALWRVNELVVCDLLEPENPDEKEEHSRQMMREDNWIKLRIDRIAEAFWYARNTVDKASPLFRRICTALYILGYILFFYVAWQGFVSVLRMV
jgi:hypothetical protein